MFLAGNRQFLPSAAVPEPPAVTPAVEPALPPNPIEPIAEAELPPLDEGAALRGVSLTMTRKERFLRGLNRAVLHPIDQLSAGVVRGYMRMKGIRVEHVDTPLARCGVYTAQGFGTLPPIVLVHGIAGRPTDYFKMLDRLRYTYQQVIMPELPGHGFSPLHDKENAVIDTGTFVQSISAVLNKYVSPKNPAIVFGHSLGGNFATAYANAHPERVRGLVLASPTGAPFGKLLPGYRDMYTMRYRRDATTVTARAFGRPRPFVAQFAWARLSTPVAQKMVISDMFTRPLTPAELRRLPMPVMLLWGTNDDLLPATHIQYFASNLPVGTVVERPVGVSHNNPALGPYAVREPIMRFAKQLVKKSSTRLAGRAHRA